MKFEKIKMVACAVLWTVSLSLGVGGSFRDELRMMFWACMTCLVACIVTGAVVAEWAAGVACRRERLRLEYLAELMRQADEEAEGVTRLH